MRYWLKACPKCEGDLARKSDGVNGWYVQCLQCGGELCAEQEQALLSTGVVPEGLAAKAPAVLPAQGRRYRMSERTLQTARDDLTVTERA